MLSIKTPAADELPPLAQQAGGEAVRLDGACGLIGYAGVVQTNLVAAEYLMWFKLEGRPTRRETAEFRRALDAWQKWRGATLYATIERDSVMLKRWAKFMGFTYAAPYDSVSDAYRKGL